MEPSRYDEQWITTSKDGGYWATKRLDSSYVDGSRDTPAYVENYFSSND